MKQRRRIDRWPWSLQPNYKMAFVWMGCDQGIHEDESLEMAKSGYLEVGRY